MNKTYADGSVSVNYAFSLLSSFTKGIMTLPIWLKRFSLRSECMFETGDERVCGKHLVCLIESCTTVLVIGRKLLELTKVTQGNLSDILQDNLLKR